MPSSHKLILEWDHAPIENENINISYIGLIYTIISSKPFSIWGNKYNETDNSFGWEEIMTKINDVFNFDVKDKIDPQEGVYKIMIKNDDGGNLNIDSVRLKVDYKKIGSLSVNANVSPSRIGVGNKTNLTGSVTCNNGYCGIISVATDIDRKDESLIGGSDIKTCGTLDNKITLLRTTFSNHPNISTYGNRNQSYPGEYISDEEYSHNHPQTGSAENGTLGYTHSFVDDNNDEPRPADSVYRLNFSFPHSGDSLVLHFSASNLQGIEDESWGLDNVNITLINDSGSESYYFYDFNQYDVKKIKKWSNASRTEPHNKDDYGSFLGEFSNNDIILNLDHLPSHTYVNVSFDLYIIMTWDGNFPDLGPDIWEFGYENDTSCNVSWEVKGNLEGEYEINLTAINSEYLLSAVGNTMLFVEKGLGTLYFESVSLSPDAILQGETAELSGKIECSGKYCGNVNVTAKSIRNGNEPIGTDGDISTRNPHYGCGEMGINKNACFPHWEIMGNEIGDYSIALFAESNESKISGIIRYTGLKVQDPANPEPTLETDLHDLPDSFIAGESLVLSATISCNFKDCGKVDNYIRYSVDNGNTWIDLSQSTPLAINDNNPKSFDLAKDKSHSVEWNVAAKQSGRYMLGVFSVIPSYNTSESETIEVKPVTVTIHSPMDKSAYTYLRGKLVLMATAPKGADVRAYSDFFDAELEYSEGVYRGIVDVGKNVTSGYYVVTIEARVGDSEGSAQRTIHIDDRFDVAMHTDKDIYNQSESVMISGNVSKSGKAKKANVTPRIVCGSLEKPVGEMIETDENGEYLFNSSFFGIPSGICRIEVIVSDSFGNSGYASKDITVVSHGKKLDMVFFSPGEGESYEKDDEIEIALMSFLDDNIILGASATCQDPYNVSNFIRLDEGENGRYYGTYTIPLNVETGRRILACAVTKDNFSGSGHRYINIKPTSNLKVDVIYPKKDVFKIGDKVDFKIRVSRSSDNSPLGGMNVSIEVNNETLYLYETSTGIYESIDYYYKFNSADDFNFSIKASDKFGNYGTDSFVLKTVEEGFDLFLIIALVGVAIFAIAVLKSISKGRVIPVTIKEKVFYIPVRPKEPRHLSRPRVSRKQELMKKLDELERKRTNIQRSMDETEREYYKRKIDEKTFKKMMTSYKQKLIEVDVEIRGVEDEIRSTRE